MPFSSIRAPNGQTYDGSFRFSALQLATVGDEQARTYLSRLNDDGYQSTGEHAQLVMELAETVQGLWEVPLYCGRADVATNTDIFEVEPLPKWKSGLRQVLAYSAETGLKPNLAIFVPAAQETPELINWDDSVDDAVVNIYGFLNRHFSGVLDCAWLRVGLWAYGFHHGWARVEL